MPSFERPLAPDPYELLPGIPSFDLTSDDIADGDVIAPLFRHDSVGGGNVSPHLRWSGHPPERKGFIVTCFDPDAPTGSGFWHWVVIHLPSSVTELPQGAGGQGGLPPGAVHARNDFGVHSYGGPAPPGGDRPHRYVFAVHALDVEQLPVDQNTPPAAVGFNLFFHVIARATLRGTYQHPAT